MTTLKQLGLFTLAFCAFGSSSNAQILYSTNFNAPLYSDGGLIGQDGWVITGTSTTNPITVANTATNGNVTLSATGQDVNRPFTAQSAANLISITMNADINVTSASSTAPGDYFLHLSDGGTSNFPNRLWARQGTGGAGTFQLALGTGSGSASLVWGSDLNVGTTYSISARYDVVPGANNDTGQLLVNGANYVAMTTIGSDATTFSALAIRQGGAATGPIVTLDNLSVEVVAIPEPTTGLLLGLGFVGMLARRRR